MTKYRILDCTESQTLDPIYKVQMRAFPSILQAKMQMFTAESKPDVVSHRYKEILKVDLKYLLKTTTYHQRGR